MHHLFIYLFIYLFDYLFIQEALRNLAEGVFVVVFPEGTRSVTGRLQPFKNGFFRLAAENPDIHILPIGLYIYIYIYIHVYIIYIYIYIFISYIIMCMYACVYLCVFKSEWLRTLWCIYS